MCCSVLLRVSVRCKVLIVWCNVLPSSEVQCVAVWCSGLQWVAVCLNLLKCVAINFLLAYADFQSTFGKQGWGGCGGMVSLCMPRLRMEAIITV